SVHFDQASTTLLYFSPWVIRPSLYCCSNSLTRSRVFSTVAFLECGTTMSFIPEISRFVISLLTRSNGVLASFGSTEPRMTRPGVVSYQRVTGLLSSPTPCQRYLIRE